MTTQPSDADSRPASSGMPLIVMILVAINLLVYGAQLAKGVHWMEPLSRDLIAWGANVAPFTLVGEPWRLFTSMFLHIGIIHIALNMYMLAAFGPYVEREFGKVRFILLYVTAGLAGSLASALWNGHNEVTQNAVVMGQFFQTTGLKLVVAAGASGALMGICGAFLGRMLASGIDERDQGAVGVKGPLVQTIGINLVLGFLNPGIDNACHLGGLVGGFILGAAFSLLDFRASMVKQVGAALAISAASLALIYSMATRAPTEALLNLKAAVVAEMAGQNKPKAPEAAYPY